MYLFCRLKPTSFWWPTAQRMWSCWCLRGCQDRHTTAYVPGGITAPPPLSASASTSKRRSFDNRAHQKTNWFMELVDHTLFKKTVALHLCSWTDKLTCRSKHGLGYMFKDVLIKWRTRLELHTLDFSVFKPVAPACRLLFSRQPFVCTTWILVHLVPTISAPCQTLSHWEHTEVYSSCSKTIFVLLYSWQSRP